MWLLKNMAMIMLYSNEKLRKWGKCEKLPMEEEEVAGAQIDTERRNFDVCLLSITDCF